jgi:Flp pilus assembly pilin Flp
MYKINKKGQSTVEYVLLVAAVIAVMVAFTTNKNSGGFQDTLNTALGDASDQMSNLSGRFKQSDAGTNGSSYSNTAEVANYTVDPTK